MPTAEIRLLLVNIDQAFEARSWHGTNLRGSIRGLKLEDAVYRPGRERHNIWELVLHCAYWKHRVRGRLSSASNPSFPRRGTNFFPRPEDEPRLADWRRDVALLVEMHAALRSEIERLPTRRLNERLGASRWTVRDTVLGIAAHDLYHAGQIQLLKRLARQRR